jgi:hypothetical protein
MLTNEDIRELENRKKNISTIRQQIENFEKGFPYADLVAPAKKDDGILVFDEAGTKQLAEYFNLHGPGYNLLKFVPASGAASRMFKHLFEYLEAANATGKDLSEAEIQQQFPQVDHFIHNIEKFAFFDDLKRALSKDGFDMDKLLSHKQYKTVIEYLLTEKGLNYAKLPKGLLKFHRYDSSARMPVGEHLVEGAHYARRKNGEVHIHFTVSPEHRTKFLEAVQSAAPQYEKMFGVKYDIGFSEQKPSTDTIAVDMNNKPFREKDGKILFRPGGHGALIENLNDLDSEVVFIKNIDNVVPDRLKEPTYLYKKVIGGLLIKLQQQTFDYLERLEQDNVDDTLLEQIARFAKNELLIRLDEHFDKLETRGKRQFLLNKLNRPIRVCGMVKNEGEPGGGPFWVKNAKGEISLQIVESSQIDFNDPEQKSIAANATHFNPVDLVCGIRDFKGRKFDLRNFVDPSTGFISIKSKDGKNLKAQELPGLWNGAMADWITVFVETPVITFNPVKTVNDLLREEHLNPGI